MTGTGGLFGGRKGWIATCLLAALSLLPLHAQARFHRSQIQKKPGWKGQELSDYIGDMNRAPEGVKPTVGSLWTPQGRFVELARDDKAGRVGDVITIRIVEQTNSQESGTVKSARKLTADSGIDAFYGPLNTTSRFRNLFSPHSNSSLDGQASTTASSVLNTSLTGTVTRVLPNGFLVVEVAREIEMNNQKQRAVLRGVVRPSDIAPDNSVPSTAIADVVIEVAGKGVISDGTRPPHFITRALLKIFGF